MRSAGLLLLCALPASAQVMLLETPAAKAVRCEISMTLAATMKFDRNQRIESLPLAATGTHKYLEQGAQRKYLVARATTSIGAERGERTLAENHRLIAFDRGEPYSPQGPLTRDELSLVSEHFDAMQLSSLLPGKSVAVEGTWPIADQSVARVCLFDGVLKNTFMGKLEEATDTLAVFTISGAAEGLENGAKVKVTVTARGEFDIKTRLVKSIKWEQSDEREQGPVSPAMDAKVTVSIDRALTDETLKSPEVKAASIPHLLQLRHRDAGYELLHERDWHTVAHTETHLVLRLVRSGELIAQATITPWKKTDAQPSDAVKEFVEATQKQPGWVPSKVLSSAVLPSESTRTIFRHVVLGKQDEIEVVQSFHLITASDGRRVVVTCVARSEVLEKLGSRDAALAGAIDFPPAK